jgi:hypothetical protein
MAVGNVVIVAGAVILITGRTATFGTGARSSTITVTVIGAEINTVVTVLNLYSIISALGSYVLICSGARYQYPVLKPAIAVAVI